MSMEVYVNGSLRSDVLIETGGSMETENSHTATSSIKVSTPSDAEPLSECDFIQFKSGSAVVYSGTVMEIKQDTFPLQNLSFKNYELTISDNSELLSAVFVDMTFQQEANIMQILYGNHAVGTGSEWYNSSIPEFDGIIVRLNGESITIGTIDDFSRYELSEPANLWGMYVRDALDNLADIAGAWWEITPDKVFNMRYPSSSSPAPVNITADSDIFDVSVSRDAFTLYSAVRVVGGEGVGSLLHPTITYLDNNLEQNNAMRLSATELQTKYPINKMGQEPIYYYSTNGSLEYVYRIGVKGLDDDNPGIDGLYTSGSDLIELKSSSGLTFPSLVMEGNVGNWYSLSYYPNIAIYARMTDEQLVNEIQEQRGGTGVIEQLIEDNTIKSFSDAVSAAKAFLEENKKRAFTVDFSTFIPGWSVGQTLTIELPYYNVSGMFNVVSLKKVPILQQDGSSIIRYDVSASTVALREKYGTLFYTPKSIGFSLGTDFPNTQSYVYDNSIILTSAVTWSKTKYVKWSVLENHTWTQLMAQYPAWEDFSTVIASDTQVMQALTAAGKEKFANASVYPKQGTSSTVPDLCHVLTILDSSGRPYQSITANSVSASDDITAAFSIGVDDARIQISGFGFMSGAEQMQLFPFAFDKSPSNSDGDYELTISITQSFSGKWLTEDGRSILMTAIYTGGRIFPLNGGLSISYLNETGDLVTYAYKLWPNEEGAIYDGAYTVSYYINENEYIGVLKSLSYSDGSDTSVSINTNIDHSSSNPAGKYDLILSITHSFS